jgi:hypothetical protein
MMTAIFSRVHSWPPAILALGAIILAVSLVAMACGDTQGNQPTASPTATVSASAAASNGVASQAAYTPFAPTPTACQILYNGAGRTAIDIMRQHGKPDQCAPGGWRTTVTVPGDASGDPRPGFLICQRPDDAKGAYCGLAAGEPAADVSNSYLANWAFYPFPANDAHLVGSPVGPGQYQCVGNASQFWTFHFDSYTYTQSCKVPPDTQGIFLRPCDAFLYWSTKTTQEIFAQYGKPVACAVIGTVVVGVMEGKPQPGVVVCDTLTSTDAEQASRNCGISFDPALSPSPWSFVPLPLASGPVDNATFDTKAGTACVTARGQSFIFTVASRAVTPGCSP